MRSGKQAKWNDLVREAGISNPQGSVPSASLAGNLEESFRTLFDRFYWPLFRFFEHRGFSREECEDLIQETFVQVYRGIEAFRHETRWEHWLFRVAANTAIKTLRHRAASKTVGADKRVGRTKGSALAGTATNTVVGGAIPVLGMPEVVTFLQEILGPRTTAYLSGVDDVGLVDRWGRGEAIPEELPMQRLRSAHEATRCLVHIYDAQTARSWFMGMNPDFNDEAPARVLRYSQNPDTWEDVILAARAFAET